MPEEIVLDMNSFENLEEKIINIYRYRAEKENFNINIYINFLYIISELSFFNYI